ncbi:MAG: hypothetical protein IJF56_04040 [Clostridia bacterium]|nr:hypothetical protein [Clostridia bacterium]
MKKKIIALLLALVLLLSSTGCSYLSDEFASAMSEYTGIDESVIHAEMD